MIHSLSALWAGAAMLCNFCGNHPSEVHVEGCPDVIKDKVLVQIWHRGFQAGIDGANLLDTDPTFMLGHSQAVRMKQGESLL